MNDREKFYAGFTPLEVTVPKVREPEKRMFRVFLFRSPDLIRGWLSYVRTADLSSEPTVTVEIEETSSAKAKNHAITLANAGFIGLKVVKVNRGDGHWSANNFPELKDLKPLD